MTQSNESSVHAPDFAVVAGLVLMALVALIAFVPMVVVAALWGGVDAACFWAEGVRAGWEAWAPRVFR